jgi:hypothetical protein
MLSRTVKAATASEENSTILAVCFFSIFPPFATYINTDEQPVEVI